MPGWFQHIINNVLNASGVDTANAFLDNTMAGGPVVDWYQCWEAMLRIMRMLTRLGYMLKLFKCKFLVINIAFLVFELSKQWYIPGQKYMWSFSSVQFLTSLQELQSLLGKLLYASSNIAQFRFLVAPIEALLKKPAGVAKWSAECTVALNELLVYIFTWVRLV